jgi:hypothetical protein
MKFVREGWTCQPAAVSPNVNRVRSSMMAATRSRSSSSSRRSAVATPTETTDTEPGGRYVAISLIVSGRAMANPTRSPAMP